MSHSEVFLLDKSESLRLHKVGRGQVAIGFALFAFCNIGPIPALGQIHYGYHIAPAKLKCDNDMTLIVPLVAQKQDCVPSPPISPNISNLKLPSPKVGSSARQLLPMNSVGFTVEELRIEPYTGKRPKVVDRQFIEMNTFLILSFLADAETTIHSIGQGGREINPILGPHPTPTKVYALGIPITAAAVWLGYHYKSLYPERKWWKLYPGVPASVHAIAAIYTLFELGNQNTPAGGRSNR